MKRNNEYIIAFGENLRKIRKERGLSMEQLAYEADVEYSQIAKIERGKVNTTISTAQILAEALKIEVPELFHFQFPSKEV